jgi:hypothetical protein
MKKYLILALTSLSIAAVRAQSIDDLKNNIKRSAAKLEAFKSNHSNDDDRLASIDAANAAYASDIIALANHWPDFLKDSSSLYHLISSDNKFGFVFWDDGKGGTVRNFDYIFFWKSKGKTLYKKFLTDSKNDNNNATFSNVYLDSLCHVKQNNGEDLYFLTGGTLSPPDYYTQSISCYKINSNVELITDANVFKVKNKLLSSISVECPHYFIDSIGMRGFYSLIHFSGDKKTLYIPIFPDSNSTTEKEAELKDTTGNRKFDFFIYKFDGTNFVYTKKSED